MKPGVYIFWTVFVAAALFRLGQSFYVAPPDIGDCLKQKVFGVGIVSSEPERKSASQIVVVSVNDSLTTNEAVNILDSNEQGVATVNSANHVECKTPNTLIRLTTKLYPQFSYGDRVSFEGRLLRPMNFQSDGDRTFDYQGYLAKDDIFYEMKSAVVKKYEADHDLRSSSVMDMISAFKEDLTVFLLRTKLQFVSHLNQTLGEPHAALAAGLVVGEKAALGKDLISDFRTVGLIHIVVLSGFNITIVAVALRKLLSFLPRVWGIMIGGIGIVIFGVMVGGGATVVRSCFMAGIALTAELIRRDYDVIRALMFAALIMLIQNPMILLHDPSFQLSFLATLGLILMAGRIEEKLSFVPEMFGLRGTVASTMATQIFVSPYILYMMGQISLIGVVVNILVLPFIPLTMLFVFLTGAIGFVSHTASQWCGYGAHILLSYELWMVTNFAKVPYAALKVGTFSGWWAFAFYAVCAVFLGFKSLFHKIKSKD